MADVTIYGMPQSTYLRTARIACHEKGISYDLKLAGPQTPELKAFNPLGRMPAFQHGKTTLFETMAITRYIDENFKGPALQPSDPTERAKMTQWMSAVVDHLYPAVIRNYLLPFYVFAKGKPDAAAVAAAGQKAVAALKIFDDALAGKNYLAGNQPTLADYLLAPVVFYCLQPPETAQGLAGMKNLKAHYDRIAARESMKATVPPPPTAEAAE